jgi:hypothetical protein
MKIKLLTFFTETHKVFLKHFIETYKFDSDVDLSLKYVPQECKTGEYYKEGWSKSMETKMNVVLDTLCEMQENDILIYCDIDVIFIKPFKDFLLKELGNNDIVFQQDRKDVCAGLFCCRVNERTKELIEKSKNLTITKSSDQAAINYILNSKLVENISYKFLPRQIYNFGFNPCFDQNIIDREIIPDDILIFHANYIAGSEKKLKAIQKVRDKFK